MTKEPIIIDDVDVSECEFFDKCEVNLDWSECLAHCSYYPEGACYDDCSENPNCYYKQLKRKEQECESLKDTIILQNKMQEEVCEEKNKELDQLKAEKEELENELNNLEEQKTLEHNFIDSLLYATKNSEWLNKSIAEDEADAIIEKVESDYVQLEKYKQGLQEITEVIIEFAKEDILTFPDRKPEENYKFIQEQCAEPIRQILQILQKCEVIK